MLHIFYLQISYESYVFSQNCYLISFFIASNTKQSKKKRKPGKSPEKERKNDKEVASASRNSSIASKTGPKKQNSRHQEIIVLVRIVYKCNFYVPFVSIIF